MQKLICVDKDYTALAHQLLQPMKEHARVDFDRDDGYLTDTLVRAIDEVEAVTNISISMATWHWYEDSFACKKIPKVPTRFILDPSDLSGGPTGTMIDQSEIVRFYGGPDEPGTMQLSPSVGQYEYLVLMVGYPRREQVPPKIISAILMLAGHFYENREAVQSGNYHLLPDVMQRLFTGLWRPSV